MIDTAVIEYKPQLMLIIKPNHSVPVERCNYELIGDITCRNRARGMQRVIAATRLKKNNYMPKP